MTCTSKPARFLILIVICAAVLWLYEQFARPLPTHEQSEYEIWLKAVELSFLESGQTLFPHTIVRLYTSVPADPTGWVVETGADHESRVRVLRILNQIREAHLLSAQAAPEPKEEKVAISVESEGRKFQVVAARKVFMESVRAQLLLKLFELFGTQSRASGLVMEGMQQKKDEGAL